MPNTPTEPDWQKALENACNLFTGFEFLETFDALQSYGFVCFGMAPLTPIVSTTVLGHEEFLPERLE